MENWYFKPARLEASLLDTVNQMKILSPGTVPHRICVVLAFCLLYAIFILSCFKVHFVCHIFKNYGVFCSFSSKHMISTSLFESCNFILFQCDLVSFYFHCSSKSSFFSNFHCKTLLSFNTDFLRKRFTCGKDHTIIQMVKLGKVDVLNIKKCLADDYYTVSGFPFLFLSVLD